MGKRNRAAYFRAYRAANKETLRPYWAARARRAYVKNPRLRVRMPKKSTAKELVAVRAARLEAAQAALEAERVTALAAALVNVELAKLITEQARDARRYFVNKGPEYWDEMPFVELVA